MILKSVGMGILTLSTFVASSSSSEAGIFDKLCRKGRSVSQCTAPCTTTQVVCAAPTTCSYSYEANVCYGSAPVAAPAPQSVDIQLPANPADPNGPKLNLRVPTNNRGPISGYLSN